MDKKGLSPEELKQAMLQADPNSLPPKLDKLTKGASNALSATAILAEIGETIIPPKKRGRGRPKGSGNKYKKQDPSIIIPANPNATSPVARHDRKITLQEITDVLRSEAMPPLYKCTRCGLLTMNPVHNFYKDADYEPHYGNYGYGNLCIKCIDIMFNEFVEKYHNERLAVLLMCGVTGRYFSEETYTTMTKNGEPFRVGIYFRTLNQVQYKGKTFIDYLFEANEHGKFLMTPDEVQAYKEVKWTNADKRNKAYVIQTLGYDPFDDESYGDDDRRFMYNTTASYLTEEVVEDIHKVQCVITMVKNMYQERQVTKIINGLLSSTVPDDAAIARFVKTKNDIQKATNDLAKENAISAISSGKKATSNNSLTGIMRAMINDNFDDVKANFFDAQMTDTYKKISEISARAMIGELNFTGDDYAKMVAEQSEMVREQGDKIKAQEEEIRLLKCKIDEMEHTVKYQRAKKAMELNSKENPNAPELELDEENEQPEQIEQPKQHFIVASETEVAVE